MAKYIFNIEKYIQDNDTLQFVRSMFYKYADILNECEDLHEIFSKFQEILDFSYYIMYMNMKCEGIYHILVSSYIHCMRSLIITKNIDVHFIHSAYETLYKKKEIPSYYETNFYRFLTDMKSYSEARTFGDFEKILKKINILQTDIENQRDMYDLFYIEEVYFLQKYVLMLFENRLRNLNIEQLMDYHQMHNSEIQSVEEIFLYSYVYHYIIQITMYIPDDQYMSYMHMISTTDYCKRLGLHEKHYKTLCKMRYIILVLNKKLCKKFLKTLMTFQHIKAKKETSYIVCDVEIFEEMNRLTFRDFEILVHILLRKMRHFMESE